MQITKLISVIRPTISNICPKTWAYIIIYYTLSHNVKVLERDNFSAGVSLTT